MKPALTAQRTAGGSPNALESDGAFGVRQENKPTTAPFSNLLSIELNSSLQLLASLCSKLQLGTTPHSRRLVVKSLYERGISRNLQSCRPPGSRQLGSPDWHAHPPRQCGSRRQDMPSPARFPFPSATVPLLYYAVGPEPFFHASWSEEKTERVQFHSLFVSITSSQTTTTSITWRVPIKGKNALFAFTFRQPQHVGSSQYLDHSRVLDEIALTVM